MNVAVLLENRFVRTPDGGVWTPTNFNYSFWTRYLAVFDGVNIVARVCEAKTVVPQWKRVDGAGVALLPIPNYEGPLQYALGAPAVWRAVRHSFPREDAVLMRVASQLANVVEPRLRRAGRPYGLEVVGDPYEVFGPGAVKHPLRPFLRWWLTRRLREQCRGACGVAYVTERHLQARYPSRGQDSNKASQDDLDDSRNPLPALTTHYSSIDLQPEHLVPAPRVVRGSGRPIILVTVASLASAHKGIDVLLKAVALSCGRGLELRLVVVGDGRCRPDLESLASSLGIEHRVTFIGQVPAGTAVLQQLDRADLFVLPTWSEGLPRAVIEAMARALPCVCTAVAGIPELLQREDLVPPGDPGALAAKIAEIVQDPDRMTAMSARNLTKAGDYREEILRERRVQFYRHVREQTETWLRLRGRA
jgi:glycosyltransferase involved in cell wall biosynthesis